MKRESFHDRRQRGVSDTDAQFRLGDGSWAAVWLVRLYGSVGELPKYMTPFASGIIPLLSGISIRCSFFLFVILILHHVLPAL